MANEYLRPTSASGTWDNQANAYDGTGTGDNSTYSSETAGDSTCIWSGFPSAGETYTALDLNIVVEVTANGSDDTFTVDYSLDGGSSWETPVISGVVTQTTKYTENISLSASQNTSLIQVRAFLDKVGGPDAGIEVRIWEIYTDGTYTASVTEWGAASLTTTNVWGTAGSSPAQVDRFAITDNWTTTNTFSDVPASVDRFGTSNDIITSATVLSATGSVGADEFGSASLTTANTLEANETIEFTMGDIYGDIPAFASLTTDNALSADAFIVGETHYGVTDNWTTTNTMVTAGTVVTPVREVCKVTIDYTYVTATLSNFPVTLTEANFSSVTNLFDYVKSDGGDIRFYTDATCETQIPHEVGSVDRGNSKIELYVKVPSLSSSADTDIYMEYGDYTKSLEAVDSTYGRNAVWSQFDRVFHFNQDPSTTDLLDSTGSGYNGVASAESGYSWSSSDLVDGTFKKAWNFGPKTDQKYIDVCTHAELGYSYSNPHYLTAIAHVLASSGDRMWYFNQGHAASGSMIGNMLFGNKNYSIVGGQNVSETTTYTVDSDIYYNGRWNTTNVEVSSVNTDIVSGARTPTVTVTTNPLIGGYWTDASMTATQWWFGGSISEIRFSMQSAFSVDWVKTERNNFTDLSSFASASDTNFVYGSCSLSTTNDVSADGTVESTGTTQWGAAALTTTNEITNAIAGVEKEFASSLTTTNVFSNVPATVDRFASSDNWTTTNVLTADGIEDRFASTDNWTTTNVLTADGTLQGAIFGSASLTTTNTVNTVGRVVMGAVLAVATTTVLAAAGGVDVSGASSLETTNDITISAIEDRFASVSLATTNVLTADGTLQGSVTGSASLTTTNTVNAIGIEIFGGSASLATDNTLNADGGIYILGASSLSTTNDITVSSGVDKSGLASLTSTSLLTATGTEVFGGSVNLTSTNTLDIIGSGIYHGASSLETTNVLTADAIVTQYVFGSANIPVYDYTYIRGRRVRYTGASLLSTSAINAMPEFYVFGSASLTSDTTIIVNTRGYQDYLSSNAVIIDNGIGATFINPEHGAIKQT